MVCFAAPATALWIKRYPMAPVRNPGAGVEFLHNTLISLSLFEFPYCHARIRHEVCPSRSGVAILSNKPILKGVMTCAARRP
jgi:hypothetical protein